MGKLNQLVAVVPSKKAKATEAITNAYHLVQKEALFNGISRTYQPKDEEGERLPPEAKFPQTTVGKLIADVYGSLVDMFDCVLTQDTTNCLARGDVIVEGFGTILSGVPVSHLLFLEKQCTDLTTFVSKLPVLDTAESWEFQDQSDCYVTPGTETVRTKKIPKAFIKYEATKEHPAQVDVFTDDVLVGYWKTIKFSGALPAKEKNAMLDRVRQLKEAVVKAREEANGTEVESAHEGQRILDFVFKGK